MKHPPLPRDERGMTTAEYSIGTLGAVCIAGVLVRLAGDGWFDDVLMDVLRRALDPMTLLRHLHESPFTPLRR